MNQPNNHKKKKINKIHFILFYLNLNFKLNVFNYALQDHTCMKPALNDNDFKYDFFFKFYIKMSIDVFKLACYLFIYFSVVAVYEQQTKKLKKKQNKTHQRKH